jgi:hypothetical protein
VAAANLRRWAAMPRADVCMEERKRGGAIGATVRSEKNSVRIYPTGAGRANSGDR